jgi:Protein of unknown function (DUF2911)
MPLLRCAAAASAAVAITFFAISTHAAAQQTTPAASARGLLRSEVSLAGHTLAIAYGPELKSDDRTYSALASASGAAAERRVRVAEFAINHGTLQIGGVDLPKAEAPGRVYDVSLEGTDQGWTLRLADRASQDDVPVAVTLERRSRAARARTFTAALVPTAADSGQLIVSWGDYDASTPIKFVDPPVRPTRANAENGLPNVGVKRGNRDDTSARSRVQFLSLNCETVLELPTGKRVVASFIRTVSANAAAETPRLRRVVGRGLNADGADYERLASTSSGSTVELTESQVPRLTIDTPVRFGNLTLRTENQVGGFPGVYGMWLKRVGDGWHLVFNQEYDVWGTQHDQKFDVGDIELTHSEQQPATQPFTLALIPTAADRGRLDIVWGAHRWSTEFVVPGR